MKPVLLLFVSLFISLAAPCSGMAAEKIDLTAAMLYNTVKNPGVLLRSVEILEEELEKRSGIRLQAASGIENGKGHYVVLTLEKDLALLPEALKKTYRTLPPIGKEGFKLYSVTGANAVVIVGKDARGLLYGVGRFLRKVEAEPGRVLFPATVAIATTPRYPVRGHQLGYRPKTNSYDAFTVEQFDQYIRELALFGSNSIEIMPPRTDDDFTSGHMKLPAIRMIAEQSRICQEYGLDVWMWYPNLGKDYSDAAVQKTELAERDEVFRTVPKLNAVFVPGGDPGDLDPDELFEWMGKVAVVLKKYHPEAKLWVSPQSFRPDKPWFDAFFRHVNKKYSWLGGIVFGPWVKVPIEEIRKVVRAEIPIRNYPDITHSTSCQYPVPDWDMAWAATLGREAFNPRPHDQKVYHNAVAPYCIGSLSYSEGTNDDVNKFIWSDQDWDPRTSVEETLQDYARLFFGPEWAFHGAEALLALEENNRGPLSAKETVGVTLAKWERMEKLPSRLLTGNARFQMGLLRAYYDYYTRERLIYETNLEHRAKEVLAAARSGNTQQQLADAAALLRKAWKEPVYGNLRQKCFDLADSLYESIGAQLTIGKHGGKSGRGNFIDYIQYPLNDGPWLLTEIERIGNIAREEERLSEIHQVLRRTDPGSGGFYDHLGSADSRHRIVPGLSWEKDPGSLRSPRAGFGSTLPAETVYREIEGVPVKVPGVPRSWLQQIEALYDFPLQVSYDHLDPQASYLVRITYTGRFKSHVKMTSGDGTVIHDEVKVGEQAVHEYDVPREVTKNGKAIFRWSCREGERGVQVAEIWLMKKTE